MFGGGFFSGIVDGGFRKSEFVFVCVNAFFPRNCSHTKRVQTCSNLLHARILNRIDWGAMVGNIK